ncbi:MAG TPA: pantoate--beta-alanine ligase [Terriglobales bacterium]|nr:pantoate--beta-alanine ligase [Terriglobales bacterium]
MKLLHTIDEMGAFSRNARSGSKRLGLVPTMGALHEGHVSLVRAAREKSDVVVVSIFVNPTQFGPSEDFSRYPRTLEKDCALLERESVDAVFAPSSNEMYGSGSITWVTVEAISDRLCGRSRPGHFRGVTTVVAKLFNIVEPDIAFFGQKDAAQVAIIRRMVRDLNFPVAIEVCPIVREADGLALSSRNVYLGPQERKSALVLHRSLNRVKEKFDHGEGNALKLIVSGKEEFAKNPAARLDYLEIVDPNSLEPVADISKPVLVAVAAFVGNTRLIDNLVLAPTR